MNTMKIHDYEKLENIEDWSDYFLPKMPTLEAAADVLAALIVGAMLGWVFYTFGI